MANRIKGITVEIGGDTTKLQTALKGVNGQIKNTQSALKDVERLLKLDPHNTELLAQKQKLLTQAIGETKEKLSTLKTAAEQAYEQLQKVRLHRHSTMPFSVRLQKQKPNLRNWNHRHLRPIRLLRKSVRLVRGLKLSVTVLQM